MRERSSVYNASAMSPARRASNTCTVMPNPCAAASTALSCRVPVLGSHNSPMPESVGTDSMSSCRHFALKSGKSRNTPVMAARACKACHKAIGHRIAFQVDRNHGNARGGAGCRLHGGRGGRHDGVDVIVHEVRRQSRQTRYLPVGKTHDYLDT